MELDKTDLRLLHELQQDGRRTVVELAETVGLTHTPCARRIRQLEQAGIIQGYAAIVDPARLGLSVQAFVQVRLERHTDENVEQFHRALESLNEVVGCFATTGAHDFMLQVVAADITHQRAEQRSDDNGQVWAGKHGEQHRQRGGGK